MTSGYFSRWLGQEFHSLRHHPCRAMPRLDPEIKKPCIAARLSNTGSPTWTRTRDLRINSTGHSQFSAPIVEEILSSFSVCLFSPPSNRTYAEPESWHCSCVTHQRHLNHRVVKISTELLPSSGSVSVVVGGRRGCNSDETEKLRN